MKFALGQAKMTDGGSCVLVTQQGGVFHGTVRKHKKKNDHWIVVVETQKFETTTIDARKKATQDSATEMLEGV